jgi:hypothetical protein
VSITEELAEINTSKEDSSSRFFKKSAEESRFIVMVALFFCENSRAILMIADARFGSE